MALGPLILTNASLQTMLEELIDTGATWDPATAFVGVGIAVNNQGADTVLADIDQATGAMATRQAIGTWGALSQLNDGRWCVDGEPLTFRPASSAEEQTIVVVFIATLATAGALRAWQVVDPGVALPDENASFTVVPRLTIDPDGRWDASIMWNG